MPDTSENTLAMDDDRTSALTVVSDDGTDQGRLHNPVETAFEMEHGSEAFYEKGHDQPTSARKYVVRGALPARR